MTLTAVATAPVSFGPLVRRSCPMCGAREARTVLTDQRYEFAPADLMDVVECRSCTFLFTDPIPSVQWMESLRDLHRSWGGDGSWMTLHWQQENERERFDDGLMVLRELGAGRALVDVGCGPGLFVQLARAGGFDALGIDTYPQPLGGSEWPFQCVPVSGLAPASFDVVTLWCVVAHDPDFMQLLRDCHRVLRPGGLILIETPNMTLWRRLRTLRAALERVHLRSLSADAVGAYGHINHFTARSLSDALILAGFGETTSHWIRNHKGARGRLDDMKRFVFDVSGSRINVSFPLVMSARTPR